MPSARPANVPPPITPGQSNTVNGRQKDTECWYFGKKGHSIKECQLWIRNDCFQKPLGKGRGEGRGQGSGNGIKTEMEVTTTTTATKSKVIMETEMKT